MARRTAYLCIGLPGALGPGTTADLLSGHADTLAVAGHHIPAGPEATRRAAWEITRDHAAVAAAGLSRRDVEGTWDGIWRRAHKRHSQGVVLAEDGFSGATSDQVALCLDALAGFKVHLVVLATDPADLLGRAWTDAVRRGQSMPLLRFRDRLQTDGPHDQRGHDQARRWWAAHHLGDVLARWSAHLPADRIHVAVVAGDAHTRSAQAGEALGRMLGTGPLAAPVADIAATSPAVRALPSTVLAAMRAEAREWADLLRASSYDVHGDPGSLVPASVGTEQTPLADLSADDRLHLTGDALADALAQLEGLRRENEQLRRSSYADPYRAPARPTAGLDTLIRLTRSSRRRLLTHRVSTR